ncbi:MAG: hypothetical protein GF344_11935 [Chitinivibrionales bacterium]|nr:hypothetical protein [Chitinivibrionales bacterium]
MRRAGAFLNAKWIGQFEDCHDHPTACQVATGTMALQWYYRRGKYDDVLSISLDDALDWIWGINSSLKDKQGVPMCNFMGSYNVVCAKMEPNSGVGEGGCTSDCPDAGQECQTCDAPKNGYDETVNRCCYQGWEPGGRINYQGKHPAYPKNSLPTSYRYGINCYLMQARRNWPDVGLAEIPNTCRGVLTPQEPAEQLDKCRPVPIWYGLTEVDVKSHAILLCGYELVNDSPDSEILVIFRDPKQKELDRVTYKRLVGVLNWRQSLYLERSPDYSNNCAIECKP